MNKILLFLFAAFVSLNAIAQTTITNGSMETWTSVGTSTEEPANFNSIKNGSGSSLAIQFAPQSCYRDTSHHSGSYSARVITGNALGQGAPGSLTTGRVMVPSTTASEGYIKTIPGDANYSMSFIGRPDSLVVWYKYTKQGSDNPSITALLHVGNAYLPETPVNSNHPDSSVNIVARAVWNGASASVTSWTRLSVPFTYVDNRIPQYILITVTSSANSSPTTNSAIYVDDFDVIYNPTIATGTINPLSYSVSATQGASVNVPYTLTGTFTGNTVTAELSDANGSFASPVVIGSLVTNASGTIAATIPAGTATGTGYRIRVKSSSPALTATSNTSNISITLVSNSIAPATTQNIVANSNGSLLTVTETPAAISREWKYSTTSGSGYVSFAPTQTNATYAPNFATAGTYYVVCVSSFPGGLTLTSNETQVNVVANSIAPTSSQSILVGVNGNLLTVTETPTGTWREWQYSTTSGGPYVSFAPAITGATTYTPNFNTAGNYYVVCQSLINGVTVYSNQVLIVVGNATLTTGTVTGSPYLFSPSAPNASVSVPFTTSGTFNNGNVFTAQLSDANGSFAAATSIGTLSATGSGTISASIPHTTAAGTGYRIRVTSSNPALIGSDNGVDLTVDQFNNSIAPTAAQTIMYATNGTALTVTSSQTATQEWKYSLTSGSGYVSFTTAQTGTAYIPNFATPGTYYVVAVSKNTYNDEVISNEVQIVVTNGTTISTSTVSGSPFDVSPSMNAPASVNFTSDVVFNAGNVFTAQLSDFTGSFASPVTIGTLNGATIGTISATIPGATTGSTAYRIRVVSSDPAITGTDNGTDLTVNPFEISVAPTAQQNIATGADGNVLTVTTTQNATYEWKHSDVAGSNYVAFAPAQTAATYTPHFNLAGTYYVVCKATNSATDALTSQDVTIIVTTGTGINETANALIKAYWNGNSFVVDLTSASLTSPVLEIMNVSGQVVFKEKLSASSLNNIATSLNSGMYIFNIKDGDKVYSGRTSKK